jgi:hypothetical protein
MGIFKRENSSENILLYPPVDFLFINLSLSQELPAGEKTLGTKSYEQYESPKTCKSCHPDF